jgi:hypothetical protein
MRETDLLERLIETTNGYSSWFVLRQAVQDGRTVHLAVMVEPFLSYILDGKKSIGSRFSGVLGSTSGTPPLSACTMFTYSTTPLLPSPTAGAASYCRRRERAMTPIS